jgi:hypothetical protein
MSGSRPSIFQNDNPDSDIDLSGFTPKGGPQHPSVSAETVRQVSDENGFHRRPPGPRTRLPPPLSERSKAKSGRTVLLNARITQRAHARFHQIIERERLRYEAGELTHRVTLGELVERALAALERELGEGRAGAKETA